MPARDRRHIIVPRPAEAESYTPHLPRFDKVAPPSPDPEAHGRALKQELTAAQNAGALRRAALQIPVAGAQPGLYVEFESPLGVALKLDSLENRAMGIEVVAVRKIEEQETATGQAARSGQQTAATPQVLEQATVLIPEGKVGYFLKRFDQYLTEQTRSGARRHLDFINRLAHVRLATLQALWTDSARSYPEPGHQIWWEVWLRRHDSREIERLRAFAAAVGMEKGERLLQFHDRIVTLLYGTEGQLSSSIDILNDLAEVQQAKETAAFFENMSVQDQALWVTETMARLTKASEGAPAVCVLDTGVTRGHPLIEDSLAAADCHAVNPTWGTHDHHGHGTESAGLALFGDLSPRLAATGPLALSHKLESVKILPPPGQPANRPDLYGAITASAVSKPEIQAPQRRRAISMSIASTDERDRGQPTSWSAAIDALAAGRSFDTATSGLVYLDENGRNAHRLFILAAGNISSYQADHLSASDTEAVHDPGQAWNALTVGACTGLTTIDPADAAGNTLEPLAPAGELSPYSTTSVLFSRVWPVKPDVVFEGGNVATPTAGGTPIPGLPSLSVLTTYFQPATRLLTCSCATSAATAQVAHIAGTVMAEYPTLWPETVRALIVDSARWTPRMRDRLNGAAGKSAREALLRRYGLGVPDLGRAIRSARNALTLVAQDTIHPFREGKLREMHVHPLPWPRDVLASLGGQSVTMRVTLSYFVEPNPGRRGWRTRHRYASHGLRFEVKSPVETIEEFRKRLNKLALDEGEDRPDTGDGTGWFLGSRIRNKGSLHSDIWEGTAADLAERGHVIVYPVSGWWKDLPKRDRSDLGARYALVVSIETEVTNVDIWTPVAQQVGIELAPTVEV